MVRSIGIGAIFGRNRQTASSDRTDSNALTVLLKILTSPLPRN